ncbi:MAG: ABC transporter substrate-binding protein [bacterium]|nr:ABC transporter substrate-binding protein [bacterium]
MDFDHDSSPDTTQNLKKALVEKRSIWRVGSLEDLLRVLKPSERLVLYGLSILLAVSALALLAGLNSSVSVTVPAPGGELNEGEIGSARFINPILTISQADEDISKLVYSGLMRSLPDGIVPDLAESYEISEDGTTYTFTLRANATFHDGTPLTAEDVLFTVAAAQNPDIKSPRRADWDGVQVSSPDARTVVFKLAHAYAPFIENTTLGILPKHVWENVPAEEFPFSPANTHPVGSGPFRIEKVSTDATGSATRYELVPFKNFTLGKPYLQLITFIFYPNQDAMLKAFDAGKIDAIAGVTPADIASLKRANFDFVHVPLPRVFGVFFNQSHATVLADASVRAALEAAVDKQSIVDSVLSGYGATLDGPIPPGVIGITQPATPGTYEARAGEGAATTATTTKVGAILTRGGWTFLPAATSTAQAGDKANGVWMKKKTELSFTIATADEPELVATVDALAEAWRMAGITVTVQVYSLSELNTSVIRPRQYDAILFGEVVGRTADLFAFWHSSQRNDPGLNLSLYTNSRVDSLLTQARATNDVQDREKLYTQFAAIIAKDDPAIFLYAPEFLYIVPQGMQGIVLGALTSASERFLNVYQWYTDTEEVWSIFTRN